MHTVYATKKQSLGSVAVAGLVGGFTICQPYDGGAAPASAAEPTGTASFEEIVVTSRKREERLQDVPAAIAAFSAQAIEYTGIRTVDDVTLLVPNLSISNTQNAGTVFLNIRGVGQYRNSEPPVAMVIDGVQITSPNQITQELYDIERIEVLKGPQGFLYGRNASGGAINIVTKQPSNEFEGFVRGTYGNGDDFRAEAVVSGALIEDKLLFRASGAYRDFDGALHNVTLNREVDFVEDKNFRLRTIAMPSEDLTLDLRFSFSRLDGGASYFIPLPDNQANNFDVPIQGDILGINDRELWDVALKADYQTDIGTITSITSYASIEEWFFEDLDWTPAPILTAEQDLDTRTWSQELRLTSPADQRLRWMVGGYYLNTKRDLFTFVELPGIIGFSVGDLSDKNRAWALFANVDYDITQRLELTLGLRYDEDRRRQADWLQAGAISRATFDSLQPKVSLNYRVTEEALVYVSYSSGFRSGGFNATATFGRQYDAEDVKSGEIGFKSTWANGRLTVNGAAFYSDFNSLQQYVLDVNSGGQAIVIVPDAKVYGLELEVQARPTSDLLLFGSLGLQDSKLEAELIGFDPAAVGYPAGFSFIGNKIPLVYKWSYAVGGQYTLMLTDAVGLTLRADYSGRGGNYWEANNLDKQNPVHIVNARATFEYDNVALTFWAQNLFKEKYFEEFVSREFAGTIFDVAFPGSPRRYGITAKVQF